MSGTMSRSAQGQRNLSSAPAQHRRGRSGSSSALSAAARRAPAARRRPSNINFARRAQLRQGARRPGGWAQAPASSGSPREQSHPRITSRIGARRSAAVEFARIVIEDDDLDLAAASSEHRVERRADVVLFVARRNQIRRFACPGGDAGSKPRSGWRSSGRFGGVLAQRASRRGSGAAKAATSSATLEPPVNAATADRARAPH